MNLNLNVLNFSNSLFKKNRFIPKRNRTTQTIKYRSRERKKYNKAKLETNVGTSNERNYAITWNK